MALFSDASLEPLLWPGAGRGITPAAAIGFVPACAVMFCQLWALVEWASVGPVQHDGRVLVVRLLVAGSRAELKKECCSSLEDGQGERMLLYGVHLF